MVYLIRNEKDRMQSKKKLTPSPKKKSPNEIPAEETPKEEKNENYQEGFQAERIKLYNENLEKQIVN